MSAIIETGERVKAVHIEGLVSGFFIIIFCIGSRTPTKTNIYATGFFLLDLDTSVFCFVKMLTPCLLRFAISVAI